MSGECTVRDRAAFRAMRISKGLDRKALAEAAGVSYHTAKRAELGCGITAKNALAIAAALQVPFDTAWRIIPIGGDTQA